MKIFQIFFICLCFFSSAPLLSSDYKEANRLLALNLNDEGLKLLRALAEDGDIKAQVRLGGIFNSDKLGFQDKSKAEYWYRRAAESQSSHAMFALANYLHFEKREDESSRTEAINLFEQVVKKGGVNSWQAANSLTGYYSGRIYSHLQDLDKAIYYSDESLKIDRGLLTFTYMDNIQRDGCFLKDLKSMYDTNPASAEFLNYVYKLDKDSLSEDELEKIKEQILNFTNRTALMIRNYLLYKLDTQNRRKYLRKSAEAGYGPAMTQLGMRYSENKYEKFYWHFSNQKTNCPILQSQNLLAFFYLNHGTLSDAELAIDFFNEHVETQNEILGMIYDTHSIFNIENISKLKDDKKAFYYYKMSSDNIEVCGMLEEGRGTEKNIRKSAECYHKHFNSSFSNYNFARIVLENNLLDIFSKDYVLPYIDKVIKDGTDELKEQGKALKNKYYQ